LRVRGTSNPSLVGEVGVATDKMAKNQNSALAWEKLVRETTQGARRRTQALRR